MRRISIKKHFTYKSKYQIWRLLISETGKLIIELRDVNNKEVFFTCYDLEKGKRIFESVQMEEKYWIGIEALYNDLIIFHKYAKPDMPGHKELIAFDITNQTVRWVNSEFSFLFAYREKIYCYKQNFESRNFYSLNYLNGQIEENLGEDFEKVNLLRAEADKLRSGGEYLFAEKYDEASADPILKQLIGDELSGLEIVGDVEYNRRGNLLFFNFYSKVFSGSLVNRFTAFDLSINKKVLTELLNSNTNAFVPDSFFVYKNFLLLLKEKNGLIVYKLD